MLRTTVIAVSRSALLRGFGQLSAVNPWRAPGSAPVVDPCGQAGGKYRQTPVGGDSVFATVTVDGKSYSMGDLGTQVLPATSLHLTSNWTAGSSHRVAWGMRYNHGGGYQYRLCPLEKGPAASSCVVLLNIALPFGPQGG